MGGDARLFDLVRNLGFDHSSDLLRDWQRAQRQRDEPLIEEALARVATGKPETLRPFAPLAGCVNAAGKRFLCRRTHFPRYTSSDEAMKQYRADIGVCLALAAMVSGRRIELPLQDLGLIHGTLLEGSNLFLDPTLAQSSETLILDGIASRIHAGEVSASAHGFPDRILVDSLETEWLIALPCIENLVVFFHEYEDLSDPDGSPPAIVRELVRDSQQIPLHLKLLKDTIDTLRQTWPNVWQFIKAQVLYINFTDVPEMESATDTRESRGSIIINPRFNNLQRREEQVLWMAHGLYHEAKHVQFFETFRHLTPPYRLEDAPEFARLSTPLPQVPCAWKGKPSSRSMGEHLLALQAFIPGLVLTLSGLAREKGLSDWMKNHIEIDMRGINGAIGCLILGQEHLTEIGVLLSDVARRDFAQHLNPAYLQLQPHDRPSWS